MEYACINNCRDTWFGYVAKADIEIEITENGETLDTTIYNYEQSKAVICRKCGADATQIYKKCRNCGSWKYHLMEGLCLSCYHIKVTH